MSFLKIFERDGVIDQEPDLSGQLDSLHARVLTIRLSNSVRHPIPLINRRKMIIGFREKPFFVRCPTTCDNTCEKIIRAGRPPDVHACIHTLRLLQKATNIMGRLKETFSCKRIRGQPARFPRTSRGRNRCLYVHVMCMRGNSGGGSAVVNGGGYRGDIWACAQLGSRLSWCLDLTHPRVISTRQVFDV